ncbi:MAG: acetyl-CoA carboxylase biotin carboxyl carrier protein [bacterium]|jgi:acetyl-CoA carboxylase biotin carboxyl carrier protein|nr:acetyl-CoA carboxylase biotin carboxyl carrier protein [Planctomycetota bacterium]HIL53349.1 acetyl-CoA carboxylase biotin carboxyl carrier protein [Planctomycetota bacterium]
MLDPKLIRRLARIMTSEGVTELSYEEPDGGFKLALKRGHPSADAVAGPVVLVPGAGAPAVLSAAPAPLAASPELETEEAGLAPGVVALESPMVGTFYRSASPESDPFASAGKQVEADTVVCIIEAMKVMNEIPAEMVGKIVEVLVENGDPVEFGQPLFLIKKG